MQNYIRVGDVFDTIVNHYKKTNEPIAFTTAFEDLAKRNVFLKEHVHQPDFSKWNIHNIPALYDFVNDMLIPQNQIVQPNYTSNKSSANYEPFENIFISLAAPYSPRFFKAFNKHIVIFYVLHGECKLHTGKEILSLKTGNMIFLLPTTPWHLECSEQDIVLQIMSKHTMFEKYFFGIIPKNEILYQFFHRLLDLKTQDYLSFYIPLNDRILSTIQCLFIEYSTMDHYSNDVFMHYLQIFYALVIRSFDGNHIPLNNHTELSSKTLVPIILQYINSNFETLTLEQLAHKFHYHTVYMSNLIIENTGKNFTTIISDLRINKAKTLLKTTDLSITVIGEMVGYEKPDYFSSVFKKHTGLSPRAFRKMNSELNH